MRGINNEYYTPFDDPETVLLIDSWESQEAIDVHHASPMMAKIAELREKYDLHMTVERFVSDELPDHDQSYRHRFYLERYWDYFLWLIWAMATVSIWWNFID